MDFKLPEIAKKEDSVTITQWHAKEGDRIEKDQDIIEVSADKATFDIAAPFGGTLKNIKKTEGESVRTGELLAEIEK